jgi:hypothetical protein
MDNEDDDDDESLPKEPEPSDVDDLVDDMEEDEVEDELHLVANEAEESETEERQDDGNIGGVAVDEDVNENNDLIGDEEEWISVPDSGDGAGEDVLLEKKAARKKLTLVGFNEKATTDFIAIGTSNLQAKQLGPARENAKKRKLRKEYVLKQLLFDRLEAMDADITGTVLIAEGVGRNKLRANKRFAKIRKRRMKRWIGDV